MKYCPYCGATLVDSAASFCAECGKAMPRAGKASSPVRKKPQRPQTRTQSSVYRQRPSGNRKPVSVPPRAPNHRTPPKVAEKPVKRRPDQSFKPRPDPRDDGYDGYYNDVEPTDNKRDHEKMDPELVKRIIFVAAGAFLVVILSVILMNVL